MATRDVQVSKKGSVRPLLTLVRGDSRTQIIRLIVDRYSGGVDLSGLAWDVVATNAAGESDIYYIAEAQVEDTVVVCDWLVRGIATSVEGETRFELEGFDRDADGETVYTWQSGIYSINVTADLNYTPSEDEEAELSGVQELILTVTKELPTVYEARDAANQAAQDASASATAANNAANAANNAAQNVTAAANNAVSNANAAAANANQAATAANNAAAQYKDLDTRLTNAETNIKGIDARVKKIEEEGAGGGACGCEYATDEEILALMLEMDALPTLVDADGDVLIGADNTILLI